MWEWEQVFDEVQGKEEAWGGRGPEQGEGKLRLMERLLMASTVSRVLLVPPAFLGHLPDLSSCTWVSQKVRSKK